jgi:hypothetical protein
MVKENELDITRSSLPEIIGKAIGALERARDSHEKKVAIANALNDFDQLDRARKLHKDLESELEIAKVELILAIDRARIDMRELYLKEQETDRALKQGQSKKNSEKQTSEPRMFSEKPKFTVIPKSAAELGIIPQRLAEIKKVVNFDAKYPDRRENIIRSMPNKGERVTRGISLKIVENLEQPNPKKNDSKPKEHNKKQELLTIHYSGVDSLEIVKSLESRADLLLVQLTQIMRQMYQKLKVDNNIMPGAPFIGRLGICNRMMTKFLELYPIDTVVSKDHGPWGSRSGAFEGEYTILDEEEKSE